MLRRERSQDPLNAEDLVVQVSLGINGGAARCFIAGLLGCGIWVEGLRFDVLSEAYYLFYVPLVRSHLVKAYPEVFCYLIYKLVDLRRRLTAKRVDAL